MEDPVLKYKMQKVYEDKLQQAELTVCSLIKLLRAGIKLPVPKVLKQSITFKTQMMVKFDNFYSRVRRHLCTINAGMPLEEQRFVFGMESKST
jgi:hypothetical protein